MCVVCSTAFADAQSPVPSRPPQLQLAPDLLPRPAERLRLVTLAEARPRCQFPAMRFPLRQPAREAVKRWCQEPDLVRKHLLRLTAQWRKQRLVAAESSLVRLNSSSL